MTTPITATVLPHTPPKRPRLYAVLCVTTTKRYDLGGMVSERPRDDIPPGMIQFAIPGSDEVDTARAVVEAAIAWADPRQIDREARLERAVAAHLAATKESRR